MRTAGGEGPLSLIHTNNCSNPRQRLLSGQLRPFVWVFFDPTSAAEKARQETEAAPQGTGWLIVCVPHVIEPDCWIVGRADALVELVREGAPNGRSS